MNQRYHQGFSITEFLVAMALGLIVSSGVISVYSANKTSSNIQNGLANIQNNGRFATHFTNRHIRMAGYQGCINPGNMSVTNIVSNSNANYDKINFSNPVFGYEALGGGAYSPSLPSYLQSANLKPDSDVIEVRYAEDLGIRLAHNMPNTNSALILLDTDGDGDLREGIAQNDIIFITDCESGDIASAGGNERASSISINASGNTTNALSKLYTTDARIYRYQYYVFYIKDTGRVNQSGDIIYGLYMTDVKGNESEIAEGVENLQIEYGIDTSNNGSADTYLSANAINAANQWQDVKSVKMNRLLNSIEQVDTEKRSYQFNNNTVSSTTRLIRRNWNNYITIRNRSFP